jgi:transcriptional regulator with XRE-family HTH domain
MLIIPIQVEKISSLYQLTRKTTAGRRDRCDAAPRRLHPPHPDPEEVLAAVTGLACEVGRFDHPRFEEVFQSRCHATIEHRGLGVKMSTLLYFRCPGNRRLKMHARFPAVGAAIKETRNLRGLSIAKLAKATGVSRRHIAAMETGANVTLMILHRIMQGLHLAEVELDETAKVTATGEGLNPRVLLAVADDLTEAAQRILHSCSMLRTYAEGKRPPTEDDELTSRAANLIRNFSEQVRSSETAEKIENLERLVGTSRKPPVARRKSRSTA